MINRRQFLGYVVAVLGGCSSVRSIDKDEPRIVVPTTSLEEACKKEDKRQLYLDYVADLLDMPEVSGVYYDSKCEKFKEYLLENSFLQYLTFEFFTPEKVKKKIMRKRDLKYAGVPIIPWRIGKKEKYPILIQTSFFENSYITGENEAISLIRDHEYFHVLDSHNGLIIGDMVVDHRNVHLMENYDNLEFLLEARAFHNQILKAIRKDTVDGKVKYGRKINVPMFEDITESYVKNYKELERMSKGRDFKADVCKKQLELFRLTFKEHDKKITLIYRDI